MDTTKIRAIEIVLGDKVYDVREMSRKRARKFWPIISEQVKPVFDVVAGATDQIQNLSSDTDLEKLFELWPQAEGLLLAVPDAALDAICAYSAELEAAREVIEDEASDRQIIAALLKMLEMSAPFEVKRFVAKLGLQAKQTSPSLPSPNGESDSTP